MALNILTQNQEGETTLVYSKKVVINNAEIKALPTTFIQLIAAPGVGKMVVLHSATLVLDFSAGGVTNLTENTPIIVTYGENLAYASAVHKIGVVNNNKSIVILPQDASIDTVNGYIYGNKHLAVVKDNAPLMIVCENGSNLTGGHANNTIGVTVFYSIVEL